jgi:hypothetical protein
MRRHWTSVPGVKTTLGNSQQSAHFPYRTGGLICLHEPEERFDVPGISFANQAAAFERISRSSFNRRFSRRSCVSSSRSVLVRPPSPVPPSRSARLTHCRIDQGVTPNSLPSSSNRRPDRCNSTICRRNSGVYRFRAFAILIPFLCEHEVSTKTGQVQASPGTYSRVTTQCTGESDNYEVVFAISAFRSINRCILPLGVFGNCATNSNSLG